MRIVLFFNSRVYQFSDDEDDVKRVVRSAKDKRFAKVFGYAFLPSILVIQNYNFLSKCYHYI